MISKLACGWAGKPAPGAILSSFHTRRRPQPMRAGSWYSPKEKWWVVSSQPKSKRPRLSLERSSIMGCPSCSAGEIGSAHNFATVCVPVVTRGRSEPLSSELKETAMTEPTAQVSRTVHAPVDEVWRVLTAARQVGALFMGTTVQPDFHR